MRPISAAALEHLRGRVADRVEARLERGAHAAAGCAVAAGGEQLGDEQRQPLALAEHALGRRLVEPGLQRELDDVGARQPAERDALAERGEARVAMLGVGLVAAPRAEQQQRRAARAGARGRPSASSDAGSHHCRSSIEHDAGGAVERRAISCADRLEEAQPRARLVEALRRRRAELGQQPRGVGAQRRRGSSAARRRSRRAAAAATTP